MGNDKPFDVDRAIAELNAAGWEAKTSNIWRAPGGALFRGPADAWNRMNAVAAILARGEVVRVRTFRSHTACGVGLDHDSFYVYDRENDDAEWHMHCGPYSTFAQAAEWIADIREMLP